MANLANAIYSTRKQSLPEYLELFKALYKISDENLRKRVTDAVNGTSKCSLCNSEIVYKMNVGTQTGLSSSSIPQNVENTEQSSVIGLPAGKRLRKRKRNCPKVVKTAQHPSSVPCLKQYRVSSEKDTAERLPKHNNDQLMRDDSDDNAVSNFFLNLSDNDLENSLDTSSQTARAIEIVKQQMALEWEKCGIWDSNGYLPIHNAIRYNELSKLKRQIYVWKFRNTLDLPTDDGDNLIQLAVQENCLADIINELLESVDSTCLNEIDKESNTIMHLAVSYIKCGVKQKENHLPKSFEALLKKVDLQMLLKHNDDGLTALHMAVKRNKYLMVEKILNVIDEKLNIKSVSPPTEVCADEKKFLKYYCNQCDNFEGREQNELKNKILNAPDMKRGCTALMFAMELGYEHIVYLLMAHMCSPTIKNLAGLDAKTYYTEYGSNASIGGVLDNLSTYLEKHQK